MIKETWSLSDTVFTLFDAETDTPHPFTLQDCTQNFSILGASGSGKTSGMAQLLSLRFADQGYSIVVPIAKTDEKERWEKIAKASGRNEPIMFEPGSGLCFDPLKYMSDQGEDVQNIVSVLLSISKTASRIAGTGGGQSSDPFWDRAVARLLFNIITLLQVTKKDVSFSNIDKVAGELFQQRFSETNKKTISSEKDGSSKTVEFKFLESLITSAKHYTVFEDEGSFKHERIVRVLRYITTDFRTISERTLSIIREIFYGIIGLFLDSPILNEAMVGRVSDELLPKNIMKEGSIVLINYPVLGLGVVGGIIQSVYLHLMTSAVEKRDLNLSPRPIVFLIDEAHYFVDQKLMKWLSTGRSKLGITVLISQSVDNYLALIDGNRHQATVDSLMNNLSTKVMCNSSSHSTLDYFSKTSSKVYKRIQTTSVDGKPYYIEREEYAITPSMVMDLSPGGVKNTDKPESEKDLKDIDYITESYIITFPSFYKDRNYIRAGFDQKLVERKLEDL